MATFAAIICLLFSIYIQSGNCLEIQRLNLVGGREDYINAASGTNYMLSCSFRSGYDDPVVKVEWYLYGSRVYEWMANKSDITVSGVLLGRVDARPRDEPSNLHFTRLDYFLAGNYTCKVTSVARVVEKTYYLHVVEVSPSPYQTNVTLLKQLLQEEQSPDNPKYISYDVDAPPTAAAPEDEEDVGFEDAECTLVWSFRTPAIFPKPNVTCGYYSFNHDDVVHYLPAGLTMHKFMNQSWQASFEMTHVQIVDIPVNHRLGCSVRIPGTTYRQMIKMNDDFTMDTLIDSAGCPEVDYLAEEKNLIVEKTDSHTNCRGQVLPSVREGPAIVSLSCPYGQWAHFRDGAKEPNWFMQLSCYEYEQQWRSYHVGDSNKQGELIKTEEIPMCDGAAAANQGVSTTLLMTSLLCLIIFTSQKH